MLRLDTVDNSIRTIFEPTESANAGATWNAGDVIVFSRLTEGPLMRVPAGGGQATPATQLGPNESIHAWPHFLPNGRHFLLSVVAANPADGGVFVASLDSKERKRLLPFQKFYDMTPVYYGGDHLFYLRNRALMAQRFDPEALEIRGDPVVVDEGLEVSGPSRTPLSVSRNGTVVYRRFGEAFVDQLMFVDRKGRELGTVGEISSWARARVSPDGRRVAAAKNDSSTALWILEADRGTATRATFEEWASLPAWMPDGKSILYSGSEDSPPNLYLRRSDGAVTRLTQASEQHYVADVSPDSRYVICTVLSTSVNSDVFAIPIQPPHTALPLLRSRFDEGDGAVSPDVKWLAFRSNESGRNEVYLTTFPEPGNKWQISVSGGNTPRWSRDGSELYFFDSAQKRIMSASIAVSDGEIRAGVPGSLFAADSPLYDVAGKNRFLIGRSRLNPSAAGLTVVVNWQR